MGSSGYQSAPHRRPISVASETTREPYLSLTVSTPQPNLSPHLPRHPPLPRAAPTAGLYTFHAFVSPLSTDRWVRDTANKANSWAPARRTINGGKGP